MVGNELNTRKFKVVFVEKNSGPNLSSKPLGGRQDLADGYHEEWITVPEESEKEIEELIVERLVKRHERWINGGKGRGK